MYREWAAIASYMPLQVLSTGLGEVRSCTLEWINSSGKRFMLFAQSIFSTLRSSQHSISSVTVYTRLCMMYLEVYVHMIALVSTRCNVCVSMHTSRLDDMMMWHVSTRFRCSYNIWDNEWWWESRLDFMRISRLEASRQSRLVFLSGFLDFSARWVDKPPVLWYAR